YLGEDGEGAGGEETLPKAKRLMIDSRSIADSVSVIILPGDRLLLSAPGASATYLSPMSPLVLIEAIVSAGRCTACFTCRWTMAAYWESRSIFSTRPTGTPAMKTWLPALSPPMLVNLAFTS